MSRERGQPAPRHVGIAAAGSQGALERAGHLWFTQPTDAGFGISGSGIRDLAQVWGPPVSRAWRHPHQQPPGSPGVPPRDVCTARMEVRGLHNTRHTAAVSGSSSAADSLTEPHHPQTRLLGLPAPCSGSAFNSVGRSLPSLRAADRHGRPLRAALSRLRPEHGHYTAPSHTTVYMCPPRAACPHDGHHADPTENSSRAPWNLQLRSTLCSEGFSSFYPESFTDTSAFSSLCYLFPEAKVAQTPSSVVGVCMRGLRTCHLPTLKWPCQNRYKSRPHPPPAYSGGGAPNTRGPGSPYPGHMGAASGGRQGSDGETRSSVSGRHSPHPTCC